MDPVAAAAYQGAARPSAAFQQMQCEELSDFQKVAECMKTELQQLVSDPNSANWDMFASNFTVLDQSGAQVKGLGPIPLDVQMLKFFKMALGLGQLPIDIKIEFNAEGPRAASNHFLASRWKVQLGGMETPFAFLQPRQVDMDAEVVFHVNNKNKIDYMRIDKWLVNGHQRYPAEPSLQELTPATPVVFSVQTEEPEKEVDIYRDTLLRYAGYLNEVGEAFRPIVPGQLVTISYALALTYVMADALDKGSLTAKIPRNVGLSGCGLAAVIDTLTFQLVASIIIPGFTINRWVALSTYLVSEQIDVASKLAANLDVSTDAAIGSLAGVDITCNSIAEKIPTALGLALIPLIVKPIDGVTEQFLDSVVRPAIQNAFPKCALPFCNTDECDVI
jgi:fission process protein 1